VTVDKSLIGTSTGRSRITIERGPVSNFAKAVTDESPIYQSEDAAREAGLAHIPAPPTYGFSMAHWGTFSEQQPDGDGKDTESIVMDFVGRLMQKGGLVLHGEEEFVYHRPLVVGDVLDGEGTIADIYEKERKGTTMTFLVTEHVFRDATTGERVLTMRMNLIHRV
jgi:peroxisomal enoyl-CoA hydratase 2